MLPAFSCARLAQVGLVQQIKPGDPECVQTYCDGRSSCRRQQVRTLTSGPVESRPSRALAHCHESTPGLVGSAR